MMYYGDTKYNEETKIAKSEAGPYKAEEAERVHNLIHHCIVGLASIQHNGNMVIKLHEIHDVATVGVVFTLYNLFQKVCIVKPYATSFLSNRQYLICKGLK